MVLQPIFKRLEFFKYLLNQKQSVLIQKKIWQVSEIYVSWMNRDPYLEDDAKM